MYCAGEIDLLQNLDIVHIRLLAVGLGPSSGGSDVRRLRPSIIVLVSDLRFTVWGLRVQGLRSRVQVLGVRDQGLGFGVWG